MLEQRLGIIQQQDDAYVESLIRIIRQHPGSCDAVWLGSAYGYPEMTTHRAIAGRLLRTAEKFRAAGIGVSLQICNTIGHGDYMSSQDCRGLVYRDSSAERLIGHDGSRAEYCFCWNGEYFRSYMLEMVREYARIQPDRIWFDDDLRAQNHRPVEYGCFCSSCIRKFNQRCGSDFSREELVERIESSLEWREKYIAFLREGIREFTALLANAVHEISPQSRFGLQHGRYGCFTGYGLAHVFEALQKAGGQAPASRPGGGAYNDHNPNSFIRKLIEINIQNERLPREVRDKLPEIESLPGVVYGKSIAGTCFETSLYLAGGNTGMTYAIMNYDNEPLEWHGEMLAAFSAHRPYWEKLASYSRDTVAGGLVVAASKTAWRTGAGGEGAPFAWSREPAEAGYELLGLGIPVASGGNPDAIRLLHIQNAVRLSRAEIDALLAQPVICDGASLAYLTEQGYTFSAGAQRCSTARLFERFAPHPVNQGIAGRIWDQNFYFKEGYALNDLTGESEIFGYYGSLLESEGGEAANAVVRTEKGAAWAVFGHHLWNNVISSSKRRQLINAANYISGGRLPAYLETPVQALVLPREDQTGRVACVSIVNNTIGRSGKLRLYIRRPATGRMIFMAQGGGEAALQPVEQADGCSVELPGLEPWSVGTVFCI